MAGHIGAETVSAIGMYIDWFIHEIMYSFRR